MARQKQIGWSKLCMVAIFTAIFLAANLIAFVPKAHAAATYSWKNAGTIHVDGFSGSPSSFDFICDSQGGGNYKCNAPATVEAPCPPNIVVTGNASQGELNSYTKNGTSCTAVTAVPIDIGQTANAPSDLTNSGSSQSSDQVDPGLDCNTSGNVVALSLKWILCPFIKSIDFIINGLDSMIYSMLTVDQAKIFQVNANCQKNPSQCTGAQGTAAAYHGAWETFRDFSVALLGIGGLLMIIAQALGWEMFDAYTVKKVLPRLLIAIIGILLSWDLMKFFVILTNDLGLGVRNIIYYPFHKFNPSLQFNTGATLLLEILTGAAIVAFTLVGLLSFALTAVLAVGVAFLVLILRQLVIAMLVIFAPLAIACSILPNTQNLFKLWHESFTKALLMFPIIMAFLTLGRVFAVTAIGADVGKASAIDQLVGFAAYVLPYFTIPFTFRFAGGAMRTIGGVANDRSRGLFDRTKKFRQNRTAQSFQKMASGTRYRNSNPVAKRFNDFTRGTTTAARAGVGVDPRNWRARYRAEHAAHQNASIEDVMKSSAWQLGYQNDAYTRTIQNVGSSDRKTIREYLANNEHLTGSALDEGVGVVQSMMQVTDMDTAKTAAVMSRFASGTGFDYTDPTTGEKRIDYKDMAESIAQVSHGNTALAGTLVGKSKGLAMQSGQLGWGGASFSSLLGEVNKAVVPQLGADGKPQTIDQENILLSAFEGNDATSWARAKPAQADMAFKAAVKRLNDLQAGAAPRSGEAGLGEAGRLAAQIQLVTQQTSYYASPERQYIVNNEAASANNAIRSIEEKVAQYNKDRETNPTLPMPADVEQYTRLMATRRGPTGADEYLRQQEEQNKG